MGLEDDGLVWTNVLEFRACAGLPSTLASSNRFGRRRWRDGGLEAAGPRRRPSGGIRKASFAIHLAFLSLDILELNNASRAFHRAW